MLAHVLLLTAGCGVTEMDRAVVTVGDRDFRVQVAESARQQRDGLSDRDQVPQGTGMWFVFDPHSSQQVWMADTRVALDVAWVADDAVTAVRTLQPCRTEKESDCPVWKSPGPVDAMLEVPAGELAGLPIGTPVRVRTSG